MLKLALGRATWLGLLFGLIFLGAGWSGYSRDLEKLARWQRLACLLEELPGLLADPASSARAELVQGEVSSLWGQLWPGQSSQDLARLRQDGDAVRRLAAQGRGQSALELLHSSLVPAAQHLLQDQPAFTPEWARLRLRRDRLQTGMAVCLTGLTLLGAWLAWPARSLSDPPAPAAALADQPIYSQRVMRVLSSLLIVISPDGLIQAVNQATCDTLGYLESELLGKPFQDVHSERTDPLTMASRRDLEGVYRTKQGAVVPVLIACSVVSVEGKVQALITLAQDLTEREQAAADLQTSESKLRQLVDRFVGAQEEERRTVARDLHDGLLQYVVAAQLQMQALQRDLTVEAAVPLERAREHLSAAVDEGRRLIQNLRPSALDQLGLVRTLRRQLEAGRQELGWQVDFQENIGPTTLSPPLETTLYRIVQEALSNARKHSRATDVSLHLTRCAGEIQLEFSDSGTGFEVHSKTAGVGLDSMRERAELLGGWLHIVSSPAVGTTIRAAIPCPATNPPDPSGPP